MEDATQRRLLANLGHQPIAVREAAAIGVVVQDGIAEPVRKV